MVHRDSDSGQFVPDSVQSADIDEVLVLTDGEAWADGTEQSNTSTKTGADTLTAGRDYHIHGVRSRLVLASEGFEQDGDSGAGQVDMQLMGVTNQLSIRNSFAQNGADGEIPAGIVYSEDTYAQTDGHYADNTNGWATNATGFVTDRQIVADVASVPTWSGTFEEGAELKMHWDIFAQGSTNLQVMATNYLYATVEDGT